MTVLYISSLKTIKGATMALFISLEYIADLKKKKKLVS